MEYCVLIMFIRSSFSLFKSSRFFGLHTLLRKYDIFHYDDELRYFSQWFYQVDLLICGYRVRNTQVYSHIFCQLNIYSYTVTLFVSSDYFSWKSVCLLLIATPDFVITYLEYNSSFKNFKSYCVLVFCIFTLR